MPRGRGTIVRQGVCVARVGVPRGGGVADHEPIKRRRRRGPAYELLAGFEDALNEAGDILNDEVAEAGQGNSGLSKLSPRVRVNSKIQASFLLGSLIIPRTFLYIYI